MYNFVMFGFYLNSLKWGWIRGGSGRYIEENNVMAIDEFWWRGRGRVGVR